MAETERPAQMVRITYLCDECGEEVARADDYVLTSNPPQYRHICPNGHRVLLNRSYPYLAMKED